MDKGKCCWVIKPYTKNKETGKIEQAIYCHKETSYKMALDDDGNRYRKYDAFCDEHKKIIEQEEKREQQ